MGGGRGCNLPRLPGGFISLIVEEAISKLRKLPGGNYPEAEETIWRKPSRS